MSLLINLLTRCICHLDGLLTGGTRRAAATVRADYRSDDQRALPPSIGQRGASLVEYALLVALIAVVCIGAVTFFGTELTESLSTSGDSIN